MLRAHSLCTRNIISLVFIRSSRRVAVARLERLRLHLCLDPLQYRMISSHFARSMFRCSNLLYFGGNRLYKNVKVCAYCGSREDSETAMKVTHPTSRPNIVFAYDGPSMVAVGNWVLVSFYSLSRNFLRLEKFKDTTELQI